MSIALKNSLLVQFTLGLPLFELDCVLVVPAEWRLFAALFWI